MRSSHTNLKKLFLVVFGFFILGGLIIIPKENWNTIFFHQVGNTATVYTPNPDADQYITNNRVYGIEPDKNGGAYIGGSFTKLGQYIGYAVPTSASDGSIIPDYSKINGRVFAAIGDENGGWYLSVMNDMNGTFKITHLFSNTTVDSSFNTASMTGAPSVLLYASTTNTIYVQASVVYALDASTGGVRAGFTNLYGQPTAIALSADQQILYIANLSSLHAVNALTGAAQGGFSPSTFTANSFPNSLFVAPNGKIYLYGQFSAINSIPRNKIAAFDSAGVLQNFNPIIGSNVTSVLLSPDGHTLYTGNTSYPFISAVDTTNNLINNFTTQLTITGGNGPFLQLQSISNDGTLYFGGYFSKVNAIDRNSIAGIKISNGILTNYNPNIGSFNSFVLITAAVPSPDNSNVFLAGDFNLTNIVGRNRIAHILASGAVDPNFNTTIDYIGASPWIDLALSDNGILYIGGEFFNVNSIPRTGLAAVNATNGSIINSFNPNVTMSGGSSAGIYSVIISTSTNRLYIGGAFTKVGGVAHQSIAAVNLSDGSVVPTFNANAGSQYDMVLGMALSGDQNILYVGGQFQQINSTSRVGAAAIRASDGGLITNFNPDLHIYGDPAGIVYKMAMSPDKKTLYFGGEFETAFSIARNNLFAIDTSDNSLKAFNPGTDWGIYAMNISHDGKNLYIGGDFTKVANQTRNFIAVIDASTSVPLSFNPLTFTSGGNEVNAIAESSDGAKLYVGGQGFHFNNLTRYFAVFSGLVPPVVTTSTSSPSLSTTTLFGNIDSIGSDGLSEVGFRYGLHGQVLSSSTFSNTISNVGPFSLTVNDFLCSNQYDFQAYAKNQYGESVGQVLSFFSADCYIPIPGAPDVTNDDILNTVTGMVTGMEYSVDGNVWTTYDPATFSTFDLSGNLTLYVRWKAHDNIPASEITPLLFTVNQFVSCSNSFGQTWATLCGIIYSEGSSDLTEVGFRYGLHGHVLDKSVMKNLDLVPGVFSLTIYDLQCGTAYDYYAYAINTEGEGDGATTTFSTLSCSSATSTPPSSILGCTDSSATNYNSKATVDNGSCSFNNNAINPGSTSTTPNSNGSSTPSSGGMAGCTDESASNFNPAATKDDGSCTSDTSIIDKVLNFIGNTVDDFNPIPGISDSPVIEAIEKSTLLVSDYLGNLLPAGMKKDLNNFTNKNIISAIERTVVAVGLVGGIAVTALNYPKPFSLSNIGLMISRTFGLILESLGLRKKRKQWGTVYDSETKFPLDPAYVSLVSRETGKEVASAITDLDGRYGFLVNPGIYTIIVKKTNYAFPSQRMHGKDSDEVYNELYYGADITIRSESDIITKNIPMDPVSFNWNEYAKRKANLNVFVKKYDVVIARASRYLFDIGAITSLVFTLIKPTGTNISILGFYVLISLLNKYVVGIKKTGIIRDQNGPVSFAMVKIYRFGETDAIGKRIADGHGRYYTLVPKGDYQLEIDEKNLDGSYTEVYKSDIINARKGVINKDLSYEKGFIS